MVLWNLNADFFSLEAACEVIEVKRHSHVFYEFQLDDWIFDLIDDNVSWMKLLVCFLFLFGGFRK